MHNANFAMDLRVELQCQGVWHSAQTKILSRRGLIAICADPIPAGEMANVLLYIPLEDDFKLFKMRSQVSRSTDLQGVFEIELAITLFAPGDERKFNLWWQTLVTQRGRKQQWGIA